MSGQFSEVSTPLVLVIINNIFFVAPWSPIFPSMKLTRYYPYISVCGDLWALLCLYQSCPAVCDDGRFLTSNSFLYQLLLNTDVSPCPPTLSIYPRVSRCASNRLAAGTVANIHQATIPHFSHFQLIYTMFFSHFCQDTSLCEVQYTQLILVGDQFQML